jgi:hypothetical protein
MIKTLTIIWISCSEIFARLSGRDADQNRGNTLKEVKRMKINKYSCMIKFLTKQLEILSKRKEKFQVYFKKIAVSSSGATPYFKITNHRKMIGSINRIILN